MTVETNDIRQSRIGESHVRAVTEKFPGALKRADWISDEQVVLDVDPERAPDIVEYLYYGRGGWLSVVVGND